jgi:tetratricopeptide (TPR) repeat protein
VICPIALTPKLALWQYEAALMNHESIRVSRYYVKRHCIIYALALITPCFLVGCSDRVTKLDSTEKAEPLMQRAAQRTNEGDVESAIRLYRKVLYQNPKNARAHLDLALLLHDYKKNYVEAIYHYRRYLKLRPTTDKWEMIGERERLAERLFAAGVVAPGPDGARVIELQQEVRSLNAEVSMLRRRLAVGGSITPKPAPTRVQKKPRTRAKIDTYRVLPGDSLSDIARKVYGDAHRWKEIQVANAGLLGSSEVVKVGQVLVIP